MLPLPAYFIKVLPLSLSQKSTRSHFQLSLPHPWFVERCGCIQKVVD